MRKKTLYANVDVDAEYDIEFGDILDLISSCDEDEIDQIKRVLKFNGDEDFDVDTLYDEQKLEILIEAYKKYSLEELQKIIKL
jgi:hypothetical protein